jgi:hypothetical protein
LGFRKHNQCTGRLFFATLCVYQITGLAALVQNATTTL